MNKLQTVSVTAIGCRINTFEAEALRSSLQQQGWQVVRFGDPADVVIINSCTVTARSGFKSRNLVRKTARKWPHTRIVITGCYAQQEWELLQSMPEISLVVGNADKEKLPLFLREWLQNQIQPSIESMQQCRVFQEFPHVDFCEHTRAFLKIQDGCEHYCSYCIIPYVRGPYRSCPPAKVLNQIRQLVAEGFQEIILSGIHLGKYGIDLSPTFSLTRLLRQMEAETDLQRLRLSSLEPMDIDDEFIDFVAQSSILCPHLHIPIQAANDRILKKMNRPYSVDFFHKILDTLKRQRPDILFGTDIIAGFPGETDTDFEEALHNLARLPIDLFHVFPYSERPGTVAAQLQPKVPGTIIKQRVQKLLNWAEQKQSEVWTRFCAEKPQLSVLLERQRNDYWQGFSQHYLPCYWAGSGHENELITARPQSMIQVDNEAGLLIVEENAYA